MKKQSIQINETEAGVSVFYGSLYNDEIPIYKTKVEEQFKGCSEMAKKDRMTIAVWGFDVLVEDEEKKKEIENFVEQCAIKYFPGVPNVAVKNQEIKNEMAKSKKQ